MKIKAITKMMNDYGTNPRAKIIKHCEDCAILVYEGHPDNIDEEIGNLKLNSFTVLGKGYLEIHAQ